MSQTAQASLFPAKQTSTQEPWKLPSEWEWVPLGAPKVAEVIMGQSPPGESYNTSSEGLPFFQGKAEFGDLYPVAVKWCTDPRRIALPGDVLMSVRAPVGPTNLANERCCIGRGLAALRSAEHVLPHYLLYAIRAREPELSTYGKGSTFAAIGKDELSAFAIPVPFPFDSSRSLDIQRRIVARIEALLAEVKEARALAAAIRHDTDRIMEAALAETVSEFDRCFRLLSVGQLAEAGRIRLVGGGTPSKANAAYWTGPIPWVSPRDMKRWLIDDAEDHISIEALKETSARRVARRAVLVVVRGMILAHTWPVAVTTVDVAINQDMKALCPNDSLKPEYLGYILRARAREVLRLVETAAHGTRRLKSETFEAVAIPDAPLPAQEQLVTYLDAVQSEVDEMRRLQAQDAELLDQLEQSILERAVRGEL